MSANKVNLIAGIYEAYAYESITVAATAIGLTSAIHTKGDGSKPKKALITVETAQIRYRYDGTNPTSSEGHILNTNDVLTVAGSLNIASIKFIRTGSTSGVIKVTYEQ